MEIAARPRPGWPSAGAGAKCSASSRRPRPTTLLARSAIISGIARKRPLRFAALILAVAVGAAVTAENARPALFFLFNPTSVTAGEVVTIRLGGTPAGFTLEQRVRPLRQPIRLYLVPNAIADEMRSRFDARLHFVGSLASDARGRGILTFAAPPLDSDAYTVAAWCPGCARYSGGNTFSAIQVDDDIVPAYRPLMLLKLETDASAGACPVTIPRPVSGMQLGRYGNGLLSTTLRQDGSLARPVEPDGSLFDKLGWLPSGIRGTLTVRGERLHAESPPLEVLGVHWGYSSSGRGSWASAVLFPSEGCWRVTGRVGDVSLTFVAKVRRLEPAARLGRTP